MGMITKIKQSLRQKRKILTRNLRCSDGRLVKFKRVNLEWWHFHDNVGDAISPVICEYMLSRKGLSFDSKAKKTCHLTAVGSICGISNVDATVWGSGVHDEGLKHNIRFYASKRHLDVRAVRGPETEAFLNSVGIKCPKIYGDPAIVLPLIYNPQRDKEYPVSLVLHMSSKNETNENYDAVHYIDVETNDYKHFVDEIVSSEKVISSSLHGIILAESYGIPAIFLCQGMENQMMKYRDWYSSTDRKDFKYANTLEEAMNMEAMPLPDISRLREKLMDAFPYDLWA